MHFLLDLDGTLVDTRPGILRALSHAVQAAWPGIDPAGLSVQFGPPAREMLQRALPDASSEQLDRAVVAFRNKYDREGWRACNVFPGVSSTLTELTRLGHACYVVTHKPQLPTTLILRRTRLAPFFQRVLSPDSLQGLPWAKADLIRYLIGLCDIPPGDALVVGDSMVDWTAAQASGLRFVGVTYGYGPLDPGFTPFAMLTAFDQLLSLTPEHALLLQADAAR